MFSSISITLDQFVHYLIFSVLLWEPDFLWDKFEFFSHIYFADQDGQFIFW